MRIRSTASPLSVVCGLIVILAITVMAFPALIFLEGTATAASAPQSCREIRNANPGAEDGDYAISMNGKSVMMNCADMAGTPKEYLTLVHTGGDFNYSRYAQGGYRPSANGDVVTHFTKVRIDPTTLIVDTTDLRFSSTIGGPITFYAGDHIENISNMYYGVAADCAASWVGASANIDLTGTPFTVAPDQFVNLTEGVTDYTVYVPGPTAAVASTVYSGGNVWIDGEKTNTKELPVGSTVHSLVVTAEDEVTTTEYRLRLLDSYTASVSLSTPWAAVNSRFNLNVTGAVNYQGLSLNGLYPVTVTSSDWDEGDGGLVFNDEASFVNGAGTLPIQLENAGLQSLLLRIDGVSIKPNTTVSVVSDADIVAKDKAMLESVGILGSNPNLEHVMSDLMLPASGAMGSTITWSSDHAAVGANGVVTRPNYEAGDAIVKLTAVLSKGSSSGTLTYNVTVLRKSPVLSQNTNLSGIQVSADHGDAFPIRPAISAGATNYTVTVSNDVYAVFVKASTEDLKATVNIIWKDTQSSVSGAVYLNSGTNLLQIKVTAEDGTPKLYTLNIFKGSSNADISYIQYGNVILKDNSGTFSLDVGPRVSSILLSAQLSDPGAKLSVSGATYTNTSISIPSLNFNNNAFPLPVTSQNGTQKNYTLIINRHNEPSKAILDKNLDGVININDIRILIQNKFDYDYNRFDRSDIVYLLERIEPKVIQVH